MTPRTDRPYRQIGRMGITETAKLPGDYYWNGRAQRWETVPALLPQPIRPRNDAPTSPGA